MIYYLLIILAGVCWQTRDILRVHETFQDSWFKKFKGHKFIDPEISWTNQYVLGKFFAPIVSCFSDLFHILGTIVILIYGTLIMVTYLGWFHYTEYWPIGVIPFFVLFLHGIGSFTAQGLLRNVLNN